MTAPASDHRRSALVDCWSAAVTAASAAGATGATEVTTVGAISLTEVSAAGRELLDRWGEPQRHYHTVEHLAAVLAVVDQHAEQAHRPDLVRLAAWFHDAVYDPRSPGDANERTSAALATTILTDLGVPADATAEVARLVQLTAGHHADPADRNGALLCDADLAVLAQPSAEYDRYAAAVRREYAHVPDDLFRVGRAAVLRQLLDLPMLYRLPALADRWEESARVNLTRELAMLTSTTD
ncbi:HD domain-containing protein [Micromonospora sp. NPDC003197]